jgi:hypothetical protein
MSRVAPFSARRPVRRPPSSWPRTRPPVTPSVLEHADAAIRGGPGEARAWAMRGVALHAMGRLSEARQAYETALRLKPGLPMAEQGLQQLP